MRHTLATPKDRAAPPVPVRKGLGDPNKGEPAGSARCRWYSVAFCECNLGVDATFDVEKVSSEASIGACSNRQESDVCTPSRGRPSVGLRP